MEHTEDNASPVKSLFEKVEDYSKTTIELLKLRAVDKAAEVVSSIATKMVIFMVIALFTLVLNIGLALWLGEVLGKSYYGFFALSGFYGFVLILLSTFRRQWIRTPIANSIISQMLNKKEDDEDKESSD